MKLWLVKSGFDMWIGECEVTPTPARATLYRPMILRITEVIVPGSVIAKGGAPQRRKQYETTPLPVRQMDVFGVSCAGKIEQSDAAATLYFQTKKAMEEQETSPLQVAQ